MGLLGTVVLIIVLPVVALVLFIIHVGKRLFRLGAVPVHRGGGVLVTGASTGVGHHAAKSLAALGYTVFGTVRKDSDAEELRKRCPGVQPLILDVRFQDSVDSCMNELKSRLVKTDTKLIALVNNAGIGAVAPTEFVDIDEAMDAFNINYFGLIRMIKACVPLLREAGPGSRIVQLGSVSGLVASPGGTVYTGCKFATEALSTCCRMELKPWKIHVSTLNPGFMQTEIANKGPDSACPEAQELYPYMKGFMEYMRTRIANGSPTTVTSKAIIHAITSAHPKTNYILSHMDGGIPSWALIWLSRMLPTESNEAIILSGVEQYDPHRSEQAHGNDNQVCDSARVIIPERMIDPEHSK